MKILQGSKPLESYGLNNELMKSVQDMVNDLKANPHLKLVVDQLEKEIAAEGEKRNEYYALIHEDVKAEFINGEIVYQSPVRKKHWFISSELSSRLIQHVRAHDLGLVAVEKAMVSLSRNDYDRSGPGRRSGTAPISVFFAKK